MTNLTLPFRRLITAAPILTAVLLFGVGACADSNPPEASAASVEGAASPTRAAEQIVVIVDLSNSISPAEQAQQRKLLTEIVNNLSFGDRLTVQVAHARGVKAGIPPVVAEMPQARKPMHPLSREKNALKTAKSMAVLSMDKMVQHGVVRGTDLLATLHTAADQLSGTEQPVRSLVILSDMLQCASGLCLENPRTPIPDDTWIAKTKAGGTLPALEGVCVSAAGPDPSTPHGVRVRTFWKAYFTAAEAKFNRYQHDIPSAGLLHCS